MLIVAFALAFVTLILQGIAMPQLSVLAFAPFVGLAVLRCNLVRALWLSAWAGVVVDLFSDDPIGLHTLNYVIVAALLFRIRQSFSHDQPLHLSLFTLLVSAISTLLQLALLFLFDRRVPFGGKWILVDLIGMPMIDALYAFVWFTAPLSFFDKLRRIWVLFWLKRKNPSPISH